MIRVKALVRITMISLACLAVVGFADNVGDLDAEKMIAREQEPLSTNPGKQFTINIDVERLLRNYKALGQMLNDNYIKKQSSEFGFCLAGEKCNDIYPNPPVYCYGHGADQQEDVCNPQGYWLKAN